MDITLQSVHVLKVVRLDIMICVIGLSEKYAVSYLTSKYTLKYRSPKMLIYLRPTSAALTSMFLTYRYHPNHKVSILPL